jgi:hypothetical protein
MPKIRVRFSNGKTPSEGFDMAIAGSYSDCLAVLDEARKGILLIQEISEKEAKK